MSDDHNPRAEEGDNSVQGVLDTLGTTAQSKLISFVERLERLHEEKTTLAEDVKEVFAEVKGEGFDTAILRKVLAIRRQDAVKRAETEALVELYLSAIGGDA